ncbi:MAG: Na+/H+ antiporter NhaA [Deltaproteobacteria bacterium]|nr:Na+/H+ antiporter NhaA [Deltaproteobacteria bacterium]
MSPLHDPVFPRPSRPIDRLIAPLERFLHVEAAGGIVLLACTIVALAIANSPCADAYHHFWQTELGLRIGSFSFVHSLEFWVNDGLMALFFFLVGLEVKRELVFGDLRDPRAAMLPIMGAIGGMVVPAGIYISLLGHTPAAHGWGVPMATDIAFVVGCVAVLGHRVPAPLRVMLLTLAIADDIGAILVIAVGYSSGISLVPLTLGAGVIALIVLMSRLGVRYLRVYWALGALVWLAVLKSGVHATIAGVILGLMTPTRADVSEGAAAQLLERVADWLKGQSEAEAADKAQRLNNLRRTAREAVSPLEYLENELHPWVSFVIMPVFALANAGVHLSFADVVDRVAVGIAVSLLVGKPVGVVTLSWLATRLGIARLPRTVSWAQVVAGGILCGIGFTMSLFVANLGLARETLDAAKIGILTGSTLAAVLGCAAFYAIAGSHRHESENPPDNRV